MGRKRKNEVISPVEKAANGKTKKTKKYTKTNKVNIEATESQHSTELTDTNQTICNTQTNIQPMMNVQGTPNQSYMIPPTFQYSPYLPGHVTGQVTSPPNGGQSSESSQVLQTLLRKMESIEKQVGQISEIRASVSKITDSLESMDKRLVEIEHSQQFIGQQYESLSSSVSDHTKDIKKLQTEMKQLSTENEKLQKFNTTVNDDLIDLKCRSMRDNMLFFGIVEGTASIRYSGERIPEGIPPAPQVDEAQSAQQPNPVRDDRREVCEDKVYDFLSSELGIGDSRAKVRVDRAHRIGKFLQGKTRPVVVKFADTASKSVVKDALRRVQLRNTPYNVSDQYPPEVQQRRRELVPVMKNARDEGKKATLIRDKLFINDVEYKHASPTASGDNH